MTGLYRELRFYPIISFIIKREVVANPRMLWLYNKGRKRRPKDDPLVDRVDLNFRSDKSHSIRFGWTRPRRVEPAIQGVGGRMGEWPIILLATVDWITKASQSPCPFISLSPPMLVFVFRVFCYVYLD